MTKPELFELLNIRGHFQMESSSIMHQDHYHSLQAWMSDVEIQIRHEICPLFTGEISIKEINDRS